MRKKETMRDKEKEKYPKFTPDPEACKLVAEACRDIKERIPDVTINLSALGSFIVKRYFKRQLLKRDEKFIQKSFFNKRKYLARILQQGEDIDEAIKKLGSLSAKNQKK